jgi:glucose/mannose-6-phosphate isomerase
MKYQAKDLAHFPEQIRFALSNYHAHERKLADFDNIILCGLGGSGIAGRIMKSYFFREFPLPIEVVSDYVLPAYTNNRSLTIQCSYSGNTEETLLMYKEAKEKGAGVIAIATGGQLGELAKKDGYKFYQAVAGFQPRMALGYSLTYLLLIFSELLGKNIRPEIEKTADALSDENKFVAEGRKLLDAIGADYRKKIAVITDYYSYPVGLRFCQQMQENAKSEAFIHELPESNHNVIESYYGKLDTVFLFLNSRAHERTDLRFGFLKELLDKSDNSIISFDIQRDGLQSLLESIYTLDWLSLLIADKKEVNSAQITNINALKQFLSNN